MKDELVRIHISRDLIKHFFTNGEYHIRVEEALEEGFECIGTIQDPLTGSFYLLFKKGNPPEGIAAKEMLPIFTKIL